jgi:hypothetical protein
MGELASRDELIAARQERPLKSVQVRVLGDKLVRVVELNGPDRDALDRHYLRLKAERGDEAATAAWPALWVTHSIRGDDGKRVFADADLDAVADWPARDLRRVFKQCIALNGLADDDGDDAGN